MCIFLQFFNIIVIIIIIRVAQTAQSGPKWPKWPKVAQEIGALGNSERNFFLRRPVHIENAQ